jgi:hypothetical protein
MVRAVTVEPVVSVVVQVSVVRWGLVASKEGINEVDEVWQLVRTSESDSSALSFVRIGCLDSLFLEETISKGGLTAARRIGTPLRRAAPYRELNSHRDPATLDAAIEIRGLRASSLRVNPVGGPNGHAGGFFYRNSRPRFAVLLFPTASHEIRFVL